jgi:hypothetical protein
MKATQRCIPRRALALIVFGLTCGLIFPAPSERPQKKDIVSLEWTPGLAARLQPLGLDLLFEWEGRIYVLAGSRDLRRLDANRIPYLLESSKFPALTSGPALLQGGSTRLSFLR